jgi:hypothetical protein
MAIGPLETFVFPGVYVKTNMEAAGVSTTGDIRIPAFIGVSSETLRVSNFEMIRGSSAIADNLILDEDVNSPVVQLTGTENKFKVKNFPIVTGDGSGKVATSPNSVIVTVNGENVAVNAVNGLTGEVTLAQVPKAGDEVRANYYYKRRDTYIENEDLSNQVDGVTKTFKVKSLRIVKGDNGGRNATNADINNTVNILYNPDPTVIGDEYEREVKVFKVTVDGIEVEVINLEGSEGLFTLKDAPALNSTLLVSYFTNNYQDTYDILPASKVDRITKVGLSQDTNDFSVGEDCVLTDDNKLHWGHSVSVEEGLYTIGSNPLINNISASLTDTWVYGRVSTPLDPYIVGDTIQKNARGEVINKDGNKDFLLPSIPVKGDGTGTPTEDPNDIIAYVGDTWLHAYANGPVTVTKIRGNKITLAVSPSQTLEEIVFVTYRENLLINEKWTLVNKVSGNTGIGKYVISSRASGNALAVTYVSGDISPVYAGTGAFNAQVNPLKASVERVTITFDGVGGFTVSSKKGPSFTEDGKTGSITVDGANTGFIGQTYIDPMTGFRITFTGDTGLFNPSSGDHIVYDIGNPSASSVEEQLYITTSNDIVRVIPGINLVVSSTNGGAIDNTYDSVIINTYNKSGNEPEIGDIYYVTFDKEKTDYGVKFFTNMRDVIKYAGPITINNKLSLAANLAFLNGAQAVALKQIKRAEGSTDASVESYIEGIDAFNEPLPNGIRPSLIQPLTTNSEVISYLKSSNAIQSSIRYKNERTSIVGFAIGTTPEEVIRSVQNIKSEKITAVYPDGAVIGITDAYGNETEYVVDGSMIAAAISGRDVSPASDIATTLTNSTLVGFKRLYRRLDNVTAALVANAGCTVLEEQTPFIKILFYITTDTSTAVTRDPRIIEVKHYVQQGLRRALDRYIGVKNLPKIQAQVKDSVGSFFKALKQKEIIYDFTGISVKQNEQDPSTLDVEAYYSPVFPLNWIVVTLNLRQSL